MITDVVLLSGIKTTCITFSADTTLRYIYAGSALIFDHTKDLKIVSVIASHLRCKKL